MAMIEFSHMNEMVDYQPSYIVRMFDCIQSYEPNR